MKPSSPPTISRLLSVCAATVRTSLQGLDFIAADGAKGFDDLAALAAKLKDKRVCDGEWFCYCQEALKAGKQYINYIKQSTRYAEWCKFTKLIDNFLKVE